MQSRAPISRRVSLLLASLITIFATSIAHAQETSYKASFGQNKEAIAVNVLVGQSRVINFDRPVPGRVVLGEVEVRVHRAGPVYEQRHRGRGRQLLSRHRVRKWK